MKTIEALISAMVLLSFSPLLVMEAPLPQSHLYKYQLAEDVWRVAYLRECFVQDAPPPAEIASHAGDPGALNSSEAIAKLVSGGDFPDLLDKIQTPTTAAGSMERCLNGTIAEIESETGLLIEFETLQAAGSARAPEGAVRIQKTIIVNGVPETACLLVG